MPKQPAFTLAELLIALVILGVIATFTIPKVLQSQQNNSYNAAAKEAIAMVSGAYQAYKQQNTPTNSTSTTNMTPFMNYVVLDTTSVIDSKQTQTTTACSAGTCLRLHNGGMLRYNSTPFNAVSSSTSALEYLFDPDGKVTDGTTNGPGKAVNFFLYVNGRIVDRGNSDPNTYASGNNYPAADPTTTPPWFSWS